jgi:hypothetical protein
VPDELEPEYVPEYVPEAVPAPPEAALPEPPACDADPPEAAPLDWTPELLPLAPELPLEDESSDDDEQAASIIEDATTSRQKWVSIVFPFRVSVAEQGVTWTYECRVRIFQGDRIETPQCVFMENDSLEYSARFAGIF